MKTELVTNVSHDLKTPLTAIITYVNLLKIEQDPERQKEYIDVLDRKSLRLKALIEDLFEISKASSKSVNLNIANIDIVNLFKQVKLEMEEKITEANLDFRLDIPEDKVIVALETSLHLTQRRSRNVLSEGIHQEIPKDLDLDLQSSKVLWRFRKENSGSRRRRIFLKRRFAGNWLTKRMISHNIYSI